MAVPSVVSFASTALQVDPEAEQAQQQHSPSGTVDPGSRRRQGSDHLFISNARFIAMISIVWVHSLLLWEVASPPASYVGVALTQLMKFGTICFFLISGYLLGEGLTRTGRLQYFYRRVKAVFVPWAFWGFVWFVIALSQNLVDTKSHWHLGSSLCDLGHMYLKFVFITSVYWFVPNFFICLALVLGLYKRVPDYVQGAIFLALSLFYGINAYIQIIPPRHTSALLGFVFYLWLGSFAYHHRVRLNRWMTRISRMRLAIYAVVATIFALVEFSVLRKLNYGDGYNTLRISNQAFSVLATLLIVKCKGALFPKMIDVRSETFGIFLIHPILLEVVQIGYARIPASVREGITANGSLLLFMGVVTFVAVYLFSILLTKQIRRASSLRWIVGR